MKSTDLYWLPEPANWPETVAAMEACAEAGELWRKLAALANTRLDLVRTQRLDRTLSKRFAAGPPSGLPTKPVRLAVLGSSTLTHLLPAVRVAALRRDIHLTTYEGDYGQYSAELADPDSGLHAFKPTAVLLAFDARHVARALDPAADEAAATAALEEAFADVARCWELARGAGLIVLQQTALPIFPATLGHNEHRLPGSKARLISRFNARLRAEADRYGVDLLAIDELAAEHGAVALHDPVYWHRAKQEIGAAVAPLYGDHVARLIEARQGRARKCLVLDLDNTLWGGVIGDDGLEGIVLGQGSALGEAHLDLQAYALQQAKRGVILAVCSKNDEANALAPFEQHPDMLLKRSDIACFVANWRDKAENIRAIAAELNIGLDSLVFLDDNPFERNLVRSALPMVATPEVGADPTHYARTLADAGYFEGLGVTDEDRERTQQYRANAERAALQATTTDLPGYLRSLDMQLIWRRFDEIGLQRIAQLINKTNQFNLTTRRVNETDVRDIMRDPDAFGLQLRLVDRFGDNGIIAIVVGKKKGDDAWLDTWLMSCRVLGRQVEEATLLLAAEAARELGAKRLIGEYIPTPKNGMVKEHYAKLGFSPIETLEGGTTRWGLELDAMARGVLFMRVVEGGAIRAPYVRESAWRQSDAGRLSLASVGAI